MMAWWSAALREFGRRLGQPRFLAAYTAGWALAIGLIRMIPNGLLDIVEGWGVMLAATILGCWWADQDDDDDDDGHREAAPERDAETPEARRWRLTGVPA
jgi:hypothetical protein